MGFIGRIFRTIFTPDIPQVTHSIGTPSMPTLTGRDLVRSTTSTNVESPKMGSDTKKKGGRSSILIPNENLYKGGV